MTTAQTLHPLAADYLARLRQAGRGLPPRRLAELTVEIEAHLSEALPPDASDADALTVLDRLGEPEEIIAAEQPDESPPVADRRGIQEWAAIFLLLLGGFAFGLGWIAGLILLWSSRAWTTRDKWIGTLILPGGLATGLYGGLILAVHGQSCFGRAGGPPQCTPGPSTGQNILAIALLAILVLAPIGTAFYLARRAG